jgi:hypothetical protein
MTRAAWVPRYHAEEPCWYLLRPDGHIAAGQGGEDVFALAAALQRSAGERPLDRATA